MKSNRFIQAAPEGFLGSEQIKSVYTGRRGFMAGAFAAAMATTTTVRAQSSKDDPNIVNLPAHIKVRGAQIAFSPGFRWGTSLLSGQAITREHVMNQTAVTYPWTTVSDMSGETIKTILEDVCDNFSTPIRITSKAGIWCEQVA